MAVVDVECSVPYMDDGWLNTWFTYKQTGIGACAWCRVLLHLMHAQDD
jgi:hypothetical protein